MSPIGLLIHGPEIVDEGEAEEAIEALNFGMRFSLETFLLNGSQEQGE
jgi:hypothetical protein